MTKIWVEEEKWKMKISSLVSMQMQQTRLVVPSGCQMACNESVKVWEKQEYVALILHIHELELIFKLIALI